MLPLQYHSIVVWKSTDLLFPNPRRRIEEIAHDANSTAGPVLSRNSLRLTSSIIHDNLVRFRLADAGHGPTL